MILVSIDKGACPATSALCSVVIVVSNSHPEQTVHQLSDFEQSLEPNMIKCQIIAKLIIMNG